MHLISTDPYTWTDRLKILTQNEMRIEGLEMFGHDCRKKNIHFLGNHTHGCAEFVYVVNGSQNYCIDEENYEVMGNQIFIAPAHAEHGSGSVMHGRYEIYWFRLDCNAEDGFLQLDSETARYLCSRLRMLTGHVVAPKRNLKDLIAQSFLFLSADDCLQRIHGCALLVEFLCELIAGSSGDGTLSKEIAAAVSYIDRHVRENITLEELASVSMLSLSRFKNRFCREVQVTPREYINLRKIDCAKKLLLTTDDSVTEIAYDLSFSSSSYFSAFFHKIVGCSPSKFRLQNQVNIPPEP